MTHASRSAFRVAAVLIAAASLSSAPRAQDATRRGWSTELTTQRVGAWSIVPAFAGVLPAPPAGIAVDARADLELPRSGRYRFALELSSGSGTLAVLASDGAQLALAQGSSTAALVWSPWIELPAASVRLNGALVDAARWRAWWEMAEENGRGFRAEPIPARLVTPVLGLTTPAHERPSHVGAVAGGLALLASKGCLHCHPGELPGMSREALRAPELDGIGERVDAAWLERWILDPSRELEFADMPALFADTPADRERVRDLVEYLLPHPIAATTASEAGAADVERGRGLYHELGCIACHGARESPAAVLGEKFLGEEVPATRPERALPDLASKWRRAGLEAFLREPAKFHPGGRMPSFLLDEAEARALAAYLLPKEPARVARTPDVARAARGAEVWQQAGCQACHASDGVLRERPRMKPRVLDRRCTVARYVLDPERTPHPGSSPQNEISRAGHFATEAEPVQRDWLRAEFAFERNACGACHARAGDGGIPYELRAYFRSEYEETDLGDEGRLPPDLGGVGAKLHASWIQHVLDTGARARPYVRARMPVYPAAAVAGLGESLARAAGVVPGTDAQEPECSDASARIGRDLLGRDQLSCIACHLYKDFPPNGSPGPAFEHFGERLRYEWFRSFLPDPSRAKPGTRMPTFGQAGKSTLTKVHGGDLHKQVDAMWCYFALGEDAPVPPGVEKTRSLDLVVGERPIVMRTFLEQAGARGIAVGLPNGLSFAYDASACRLVDAWKGAFLDASGPWADRGGNNAGGQGAKLWQAPGGPALVLGALPDAWPEQSDWTWKGYVLDANGSPVFEAAQGAVTLRERVDGALLPRTVLRRHFELAGLAPRATVSFRGGADPAVELGDPSVRRAERDALECYELTAAADGRLEFHVEVKP